MILLDFAREQGSSALEDATKTKDALPPEPFPAPVIAPETPDETVAPKRHLPPKNAHWISLFRVISIFHAGTD